MKRKKLFISIIFLIVSIMIGYLNYYIASSTKETQSIYVLTHDQIVGTKITKDMLRQKEIGKYNMGDTVVKELSEIEGKYLLQSVKAERLLYSDMLTDDVNQTSFSSKIINTAVTVKTDLVSSVAAELKPDSIIQIALISKNQDGSAIVTYPSQLNRIRVLKMTIDSGQEITEEKDMKSNVTEQRKPATLTLDLTDEQTKIILPYVYAGNIHCILLNETISSEYRKSIGLQ